MQKPFKFIDYVIAERENFVLGEGCQPTHALFYLQSGEFEIDFEDKTEKISRGDLCILPSNIRFRRRVVEPISFMYIKFTRNEVCPFSIPLPHGKIEFKDRKRFEADVKILENISSEEDIRSVYLKEHIFEDILLQIFYENRIENSEEKKENISDSLVCSAIEKIDDLLGEKITIGYLCQILGTNASTLNFKFRKELRMSVGNYICAAKMKRAYKLITTTNYSVSEIATKCGFDNVYYFSTSFKNFYGMSPKNFKNMYFGNF